MSIKYNYRVHPIEFEENNIIDDLDEALEKVRLILKGYGNAVIEKEKIVRKGVR